MRVGIRLDASVRIGVGHLMRCLTLADFLRDQGNSISFFTRGLTPALEEMLVLHGHQHWQIGTAGGAQEWQGQFEVDDLYADADSIKAYLTGSGMLDWLVVDHYGLDVRWENRMRDVARRILVIDDLADRTHDCDVLLDQNYCPEGADRYRALVPSSCRQLIGCGNALLKEEFRQARSRLTGKDGVIRNVLVFYGGGDATNETSKAVEALKKLSIPVQVNVVIGAMNPHGEALMACLANFPDARLHQNVDYMPALMVSADICLGAAGTTTWERCALGLPTIMTGVAKNQVEIAANVDSIGAARYLGYFDEVTAQKITGSLELYVASPSALRAMSSIALDLVDGSGVMRVADCMKAIQ